MSNGTALSVETPPAAAVRAQRSGVLISRKSFVQAGAVLFDQGVCSLTNFLTGVIVARASMKAEYGSFVLVLTVLRFIGGIQNSIVGMPFTIHFPRIEAARKAAYLGNTLASQIGLSVAVGLLFVVGAIGARLAGAEAATVRLLDVLILVSVAFIARDSLRIILLGQLRVWENLWLTLLVAALTLGGLGVAHQRAALDVPTALVVIGLGAGLPSLLIGALVLAKRCHIERETLYADFALNWSQGKWLTVRTFLYMAAFSAYPFFLRAFADAEQVAAYGVCFSISSLANPIFMGLGSYLRPKFSHLAARDERTLRAVVLKVEAGLTVVAGLLVVFLAFWGQSLVNLLYGPRYAGLQWSLILTTIAVAVVVMELPFVVAAEAMRNTKATSYARLYSLLFTMFGGALLVWAFGLYGAVVGVGLSHLVGFLYLLSGFVQTRCSPMGCYGEP